jgi:hypothetical protein
MVSKRGTKAPVGQEASKDVEPLVSQETADTLVALKEAAATFDARLGDTKELRDADDLGRARDVLLKARSVVELAESSRAAATAPYRAKAEAVVALFKPIVAALVAVRNRAESLASAYMLKEHQRQQREAQEAERARLEAEARQREAERAARAEQDPAKRAELQAQAAEAFLDRASVPDVQTKIEGTHGALGGLFVEDDWTFEVTNFDEIPREYLAVDPEKVRVAAASGVKEIPGLRLIPTPSMGARRSSR